MTGEEKIIIDYIDNIIKKIDDDYQKVNKTYSNALNTSEKLSNKYYGYAYIEETFRKTLIEFKKNFLKEKEKERYDRIIENINLIK